MASSLFAIHVLLGMTLAQTSTLTLPFYGYDQQSIVGSVVSISNQVTTIQLACPENTDGSDCGLFPYQTLTVGPSTYNMFMSAPGGAFIGTQECSSASVCTESNGGSEANFPGSSVTTYDASDVASLPVTVTAGADQLGSGGAAGTTTTTRGVEGATSTASTGSNASSQTTASVNAEMSGTTARSSASQTGTATESAASTSSSSAALRMEAALGGGLLAAALGLLGGFVL
ncbi:hypothetical protein AC579_5041 [Pseudocercospora musae]|uniref:GPI anchored protein n=1 Tax=Pseudocercospora musae TaxID=113226 RepID=A0A139IB14_9PEZI|nr:hypothetical protein AC579_5041 [Pseudocercospora musae]